LKKYIYSSLIASFAYLGVSSSVAQSPVIIDKSGEEGSVVVYTAEFFAPYNPLSAEDMINRLPGVEGLIGGFRFDEEERRGLRSNTDQILIDGKRLTGKEMQSSQVLQNLSAQSVDRIELITGNVKELDTEVGVRVINVILKPNAGKGSGVAEIGGFSWPSGQRRPFGSLSYNSSIGNLSYSASFLYRPWVSPVDITDVITTPEGGRLSVVEQFQRQGRQAQHIGRGSFTYNSPSGKVLSVNALIEHLPLDKEDETVTFADLGDDPLIETERNLDVISGKDTTWEISGDYSHPFGKRLSFTGLFVYSNEITDRNNNNFELIEDDGLAEFLETFGYEEDLTKLGGDDRDQTSTETILRGTLDWNPNSRHEFEIGVEGALNTLDKDINFFRIENGERLNIPIINSDQKISEDRVEAFTTYSWKPFNALEIETGVAAEFSWLDQVGSDVSSERYLSFVKPSIDFFINPSQFSQIYLSLRRDVGQLNFRDFIAKVNREDDEVLPGNPNLVPEKSWDAELGLERRFSNGAGVLNWRAYYRRVSDVKDLIPFGVSDSQPGNLGRGDDYGTEIKSSIRFGRFSKFDAVLSASALFTESKVIDPFTGVKRRFGNQHEYEFNVNYRHDVKSLGLSYGFDVFKLGPSIESDFDELDEKSVTSDLRVFMEKTITRGVILRLFWANALEVTSYRKRTIFSPSQVSGNVEQIQFRKFERAFIAGARLRSTF